MNQKKDEGGFLWENRKAQGLSVNAIILIILGLVILVVLIIGFTSGWKSFSFLKKSNNVDDLTKICQLSCDTQSEFGYCTSNKKLSIEDVNARPGVYEDGKEYTCDYLVKNDLLRVNGCETLCPSA